MVSVSDQVQLVFESVPFQRKSSVSICLTLTPRYHVTALLLSVVSRPALAFHLFCPFSPAALSRAPPSHRLLLVESVFPFLVSPSAF